MQPWSQSRPPRALAEITRPTSPGDRPASARAARTAWLAMVSGARSRRSIGVIPIPTMLTSCLTTTLTSNPGCFSYAVLAADTTSPTLIRPLFSTCPSRPVRSDPSTAACVGRGGATRPANSPARSSNCTRWVVGGDEHGDVLRPGLGEARQCRGAGPGVTGHEVTFERRAGRPYSDDIQASPRAVPSEPPTDTKATMARATVGGSRPARSASLSRRPSAAPYSAGERTAGSNRRPAARRGAARPHSTPRPRSVPRRAAGSWG